MSNSKPSLKMTRRSVLATGGAAVGARFLPKIATSTGGRRILTVYFDKTIGAMRAIERLVP
ncbi:Tat pathway signal protein [Amylibacter kogurei]|uniref:Tat pathway signal protein n=1 Tax=Paramylibacter kogurei TaxID=1889778 RepID=A0A2G5K1T9_9RHOB|nr:Tat pathway signal protein [Amylibacter kogurei]PIB23506.1 Tat pathway signal protein [Amylibacter kogurei]